MGQGAGLGRCVGLPAHYCFATGPGTDGQGIAQQNAVRGAGGLGLDVSVPRHASGVHGDRIVTEVPESGVDPDLRFLLAGAVRLVSHPPIAVWHCSPSPASHRSQLISKTSLATAAFRSRRRRSRLP
jgi:hypothetical protein